MCALCECGCGQDTAVADHSDRSKGWVKGHPLRFIKGHNLSSLSELKAKATRGNRGMSSHGYVRINTGKNCREYEHVLTAERFLGRKLNYISKGHAENEVVHHVDGDKTNNALENLVVMTHGEHVRLHNTRGQSNA